MKKPKLKRTDMPLLAVIATSALCVPLAMHVGAEYGVVVLAGLVVIQRDVSARLSARRKESNR